VNARVGAKTDTGRVREANEDAFLVEGPLFAVADGMGGHLAGDVASRTAVETITTRAEQDSPGDPGSLARLVREANHEIWKKAQSDASLHGMGTTCTLAMLDDSVLHIAHVGDSRAYLFRDGDLSQLTEDHTLVGRMVREGRLRPDEAEHHPQRSIITRALGVDSDVAVDTQTIELREGDRVLLCSDGLSSMVERESIAEALGDNADPQEASERLVQLANEAGGEDNITVVVIEVAGDAPAGAATAKAEQAPPPPAAAPVRADTDPAPARDPRDDTVHALTALAERPKRRWLRALLVTLVVIAILVGGAYALLSYSLSNSWFVGINEAGVVTIFQGRPEEVAGFSLSEEHDVSDLALAEVPEFLRDNVREGIKVDSLDEARARVADLEERAQDEELRGRDGTPNRRTRNQRDRDRQGGGG
jgi:serine/threonine protein phosphatase PrpC